MECSGIFEGAIFDCDNVPIAGVEETLILMNLSDIESVTFDLTNPNVITDITLKEGASAFEFQGTRNSLVPETHFVPGRFSVGYDHQTAFQVFDFSQSQKDNMERLAIRETVGVVQNANKTFEVYGITQGLELLNNDRLPGDQDTGGSYTIILKTSDNTAREPKLPQTWLDTDFATTLAAVEALVNQPRIDNISPIAGSAAGGDAYVITGANFQIGITPVDNVDTLDWIDSVLAVTNEPTFTIDSPTQITVSTSVALTAGTYSIRATAPNNSIGQSAAVVVIT